MAGSCELTDWQHYPQNLSRVIFHEHEYDLEAYSNRLRDESARLFICSTHPISLKTIDVGQHKVNELLVTSRSQFEEYLQKVKADVGFHVILIPQQGSWGKLVTDESCTRKMLSKLNVFPRFLDVLRSFGQRTGFEDDSTGGIYMRSDERKVTHEITYLVKLVEEHGRTESSEPWSIRQMGVYHRQCGMSGNIFIVLNPSKSFLRRLKNMREDPERFSPGSLHCMILSCGMENWRWYIRDLETRYITMKTRAQLTRVNEDEDDPFLKDHLHIADAQEIQVLQDKCQQLAHTLDLTCELMQQLKQHLERIQASSSCIESLVSLLSESTVHVKRADRLLKKLDGTIALTQKILDFRCLESLRNSSGSMEKLARLTRDDNLMMKDLTEKAARDTDAMRWITFLTLIYLPASFVATMMGMNYITVRPTKRSFSIEFAREFWIFFFLTAIFLVITLILYYVYIRRARVRDNHYGKSQSIEKDESVSTQ